MRWQKFSMDRLFVNDEAGTRIGWVDIETGVETIEKEGREDAFRAAVAAWRRENPAVAMPEDALPEGAEPERRPAPEPAPKAEPQPTPVPAPASSRRPAARPGRDLALNRPGEAVRARADEEWQARKDRSKFRAYAARVLDAHTDERAWRVGAQGEEKVGPKLEKLIPLGWRVLHSIPVGRRGADIDHLLVGPGGVFTVNTKMHPGAKVWVAARQIRINGQPAPYLRDSRFEGERASRTLTAALGWAVTVTPVLVILTGDLRPDITYKGRPDDVLVLDSGQVPRAFKKKTGVLDADAVAEVFEVARWEGTWRG